MPFSLFILLLLLLPIAALAESSAMLQSITWQSADDGSECITLQLDKSQLPKIFFVTDGAPRLVLDFPETRYTGKPALKTGGKLVEGIRTAQHQTPALKIRVVLDLARNQPVVYQEEFLVNSNTLQLVVRPKAAAVTVQTEVPAAKTEPEKIPLPAAEPASASSSPPAPAVAPAKTVEKPAATLPEKTASADTPAVIPPAAPPAAEEQKLPEAASTAASAPPADLPAELLELSFAPMPDGAESVRLRLSGFVAPAITAREGNAPQVICDFSGMRLSQQVQKRYRLDGRYVSQVAVSGQRDPAQVRLILDLQRGYDYDLRQVYYKDESLFLLVISTLKK